MIKLGLYWVSYLQWLVLIPLYACLAPICMISSALFRWIMSWIAEDQELTLLIILIVEWGFSALLIFELMFHRAFKSIFYYQFVLLLVFSNFALIGITYSLLGRENFIQEFTAKLCTTLFMILLAEKIQIKFKYTDNDCDICLSKMNEDCIILKCSHYFHEKCLWEWKCVKSQCPKCLKPFS